MTFIAWVNLFVEIKRKKIKLKGPLLMKTIQISINYKNHTINNMNQLISNRINTMMSLKISLII